MTSTRSISTGSPPPVIYPVEHEMKPVARTELFDPMPTEARTPRECLDEMNARLAQGVPKDELRWMAGVVIDVYLGVVKLTPGDEMFGVRVI